MLNVNHAVIVNDRMQQAYTDDRVEPRPSHFHTGAKGPGSTLTIHAAGSSGTVVITWGAVTRMTNGRFAAGVTCAGTSVS